MIEHLEERLSFNAKKMKRSEIRELLKLTARPEIISFAGGLPAPQSFPVNEIREIACSVLDSKGTKALQYGPTEGVDELREELCKLLLEDGIKVDKDNILVTTASQQGLDLVGKVFVDPDDPIIVEEPSYVGAIGAFRSYSANMIGVEMDDEGVRIDLLEATLKELDSKGVRPKFVYVIPDFHNPAGVTLPLERRKKILELARQYDLVVIEDSPYRMIRFRGEHIPPLQALDEDGRVVSLYTFSKILVPGFRLGWMVGPKELIDKFVVAKQAMDLCTPPFNQYLTAEFLRRGLLKKTVKRTVAMYKEKNELMLECLEKYMPKGKGVKWTKPDGGLFLWVTLPEHVDTGELFKKAIEHNVAFVIGSAFYPKGDKNNSFRVNFSYPSKEQIEEGVKRLGMVISEALK